METHSRFSYFKSACTAARKFPQTAARDVEGCVNRHGNIFTLSSHFQVLRVFLGFDPSPLSLYGCILGGTPKSIRTLETLPRRSCLGASTSTRQLTRRL